MIFTIYLVCIAFQLLKGGVKIERFKAFFIKTSKKKTVAQVLALFVALTLITIIIITRKTINVVIDGKPITIVTYKDTLAKALENAQITVDPKDTISVALNAKITNKETINIKQAVNVELTVDGKTLKFKTAEPDVASMLKAEGVSLKDKDKITPSKETLIATDMKVNIVRVEVKTITTNSDIPFSTVIQNNKDLAVTVKKTAQEGKTGEKVTTTDVVYEDGNEVSRSIVKETISRKPLNKIVVQGTLPVLQVSRGGDSVPYTKVLQVKSTAYEPVNGMNSYTASGRKSIRDPNGYSTIAVDPSVIPLGTRLYVEGYGYAVAADTGTSIKGNFIDVFFNNLKDANNWAVRYVKVYILK